MENQMNQETIFRFLVVASIVIAVLGTSLDLVVPGLLPAVLEDAYEAHVAAEEPMMSRALTLIGFMLVLLIGSVVGTIGLLLFKPWGRQLSLWLSVLAVLSYPFLGPIVNSGWATMLHNTSIMLWGAALAMAYFAEIKVRFERDFSNNSLRSTREDARA
jgi:hypothetical protein